MDDIDTTEAVGHVPGIYLIRCRVTNAAYTGSTKSLTTRVETHLSQLRAGINPARQMPKHWQLFGESQFEFDLPQISQRVELLGNVDGNIA